MSSTLPRLPEARLSPLSHAYGAAATERRRQLLIGAIALGAAVIASGVVAEVDLARMWANIHRMPEYIDRIFRLDDGRRVWMDVGDWMWGAGYWAILMGETVLIAYLGTLTGAIGGLALCFAASANLSPSPLVRGCARRCLEFCRTVPELVFALIFVQAFGLGPLPGVLAIAIHTIGALGKLFAEAVENIDMGPVEGISSCGASRYQAIRYAVMPQVASNLASYALLRFEINVRGAAVMGFVGAGGIGQDLIEAIRKFYYPDVSAMLVLIVLSVTVIDIATERLRHALLGWEQHR